MYLTISFVHHYFFQSFNKKFKQCSAYPCQYMCGHSRLILLATFFMATALSKHIWMTFYGSLWQYIFWSLWGHSQLGYYFWVSTGLRIVLDNFTYFVCLNLYCGAYFGSYLHFILHIEYTDKVNLEGIRSSKTSFWFKGVVKIVHFGIKEWKGQQKLIKTIPIFFPHNHRSSVYQ